MLLAHKEIIHKLDELERKIENHDVEIRAISEAIRELMAPPRARPRVITGFRPVRGR